VVIHNSYIFFELLFTNLNLKIIFLKTKVKSHLYNLKFNKFVDKIPLLFNITTSWIHSSTKPNSFWIHISFTCFPFKIGITLDFFYIYFYVQFLSGHMRLLNPFLNWRPLDLASISIIFPGICHCDIVLDLEFDSDHFTVVGVWTRRNI